MREEEAFYINDTTREIRLIIARIELWRKDNDHCDQRHAAMVITKLEEAELLSLRMVKQD